MYLDKLYSVLPFLPHYRTTFSEFAAKHAKDSRFKAIEKMKDREAIFIEFMTSLRKREKDNSKNRGEKLSMRPRKLHLWF